VNAFCKAGRRWIRDVDLGPASNWIRDELLRRMDHFDEELEILDGKLSVVARGFPEAEALQDLHGIGQYSALLVIAEIGEPWRFRDGRLVGAYAGLTPRVNQSGDHCYHGHITHQGSPWLRWILIQAAIHVVRRDPALRNFYERIRKRSSAKIARVAVARKLASICWVRLMRWHQLQAA
jgi:transposase